MDLYEKYVKPLWADYGLRGAVIAVALGTVVIVVLVALALWAGVDLGGYVNRLLGQ